MERNTTQYHDLVHWKNTRRRRRRESSWLKFVCCYAMHQGMASLSVIQGFGLSEYNIHVSPVKSYCCIVRNLHVTSCRKRRLGWSDKSRLHFSADGDDRQSTVMLPPWLQNEKPFFDNDVRSVGQNEQVQIAERNVAILRSYMEYSRRFTDSEINDVMDALIIATSGDSNKLAGAANFLWLLLSVDDTQIELPNLVDENDFGYVEKMMSRDALIASAFHYCDCVTARNSGVYEIIEEAVKMSSNLAIGPFIRKNSSSSVNKHLLPFRDAENFIDIKTSDSNTTSISRERKQIRDVNQFGEEVSKIAIGAARIKRAEVLADTVLSTPARSNAGSLQNLLLSVSEDWRALAIRSVASLYRLKGIISFREKMGEGSLSRKSGSAIGQIYKPLCLEEVKLSREALTVYAPLAQRLGMQRLKNELEGNAFRLLYPRQYHAAMSLYKAGAPDMFKIAYEIRNEIETVLSNDSIILNQANTVSVITRVKEPYSLWRKLLKLRMKSSSSIRHKNERSASNSALTFSLLDVNDAIAVRIIIETKTMSDDEDKESFQTREKLLCYYVQQKCIDLWPVSDPSRIKDYIANPKDNGYQSLHHTSFFFRYGIDWPFEVQVRSKAMHQLAEFGVAAHWDYKLQGKGIDVTSNNLPESSTWKEPTLALPPQKDFETTDAIDIPETDTGLDELKEAKARADRLAPYLDALTNAQTSIKETFLYVFVSPSSNSLDGKLLPIPKGSKISCALEHYHELINEQDECMGEIILNGIVVTQDINEVLLKNGDVITISIGQ